MLVKLSTDKTESEAAAALQTAVQANHFGVMQVHKLALTFPRERPQRNLRTVVTWARYAALFKYSSDRRVLPGLQQPAATP